ncbi:MAG: cardiolipin synthase [Lactobacillales bacterium]|jgi:cardiolipin synthase|nr:cardiolipin synthase [Lactobacillales bacterium]
MISYLVPITLWTIKILFIIFVVFREKKNAATLWTWIFVITVFNFFGFILYMFLGKKLSKDRIFSIKAQQRLLAMEKYEEQQAAIVGETYPNLFFKGDREVEQLITQLNHNRGALYTKHNEALLYTNGQEMFDKMFEDIDNAKHHIHLEYYIFKTDKIGLALLDHLHAALKRGVKVRLLIDSLGARDANKKEMKKFVEAGGELTWFFKLFLPMINPRLIYRLHRKIVVIDGEIGYTGGFNVGDEYLGYSERYKQWRDSALRVRGEIILSLQNRFLKDWNSQADHAIKVNDSNVHELFNPQEDIGQIELQMVNSDPVIEKQNIKFAYLKMINMAKKEILIQTPYLIPDQTICDALVLAAQSGVDVTIQIPSIRDHIIVYWATYSYAAELMDAGVKIEIYDRGFMHSKAIVIDREISTIGSCNMDYRSFMLDFEGNLIIYNEELSREVARSILDESPNCHVLTPEEYAARSLIVKFKEIIARLVAPML